MDALDRILPLASLLWPVLDCDVSISRDPATTPATYRARVFDADHPDGLDARPQASASGATPTEATEALAALLAERARPQLDALLRAAGYPTPDASTRADLAIARGERDGLRVELDAAREEIRARASAIGALAAGHAPDFAALADRLDGCALHALRRIAERLDDQAAHRAAREGVDLRVWVRRSDVKRLCECEARGQLPGVVAALTVVGELVMDGLELPPEERDLRGDHVEGGGGHGGSR